MTPHKRTLEDWDVRFMRLAHHLAGWSKELGRKVGCVVVGDDKIIRSTGYNGFPRSVDDEVVSRYSRETGMKYIWSCHAETNAIHNAARLGISVLGCTLYVPWFPCVECTKAVIQSGIARVVAYEPDTNDARWGHEFKVALEMLREANVGVRYIQNVTDPPLGSVS